MDKEGAIKFLERFIEVKEQELDWFYKQDEDYYKDSIEELELAIQAFKTILKELEKKDKEIKCLKCLHNKQANILDLMAEDLSNLYNDYEPCYIKENMDCKKYKSCIDCIKEYFYKKVEG